ncbi:MAG: methyl-accepting chemotaxis protein [Bacteroidota bacterium]
MLNFVIFAIALYGLTIPTAYFVAKRYLKNNVLLPVVQFILLFLGVSAFLFYLIGTLGPWHLTWVIPASVALVYGSVVMAGKYIAKTFAGLNDAIKSIASGDLSIRFTGQQATKNGDAVSEIYKSLDRLVVNQANVIKKLIKEVDNTLQINKEVTQRASDIFEKVTNQASTLEEISASMEEMLTNIEQNAFNSKQTESIANKSGANISVVNKAVEGAVNSVKDIISKTSIINEFAMKTNLLSLNAAVEAANAGEYGKGFAVVASEVRKLAENSKNTSNEISVLSTKSLKTFERSVKLLETVVPEIQKTASLVQEISAATEEQRMGAEQINSAMQQLNSFTQDNATALDDLNAYSEALNKSFIKLNKTIGLFRISVS